MARGMPMPSLYSHSLIGYWPLWESSGTRPSLIGALDLTDNNTVTGNDGRVVLASQFTAANNEYLSRASEAALQFGDTYVCWFAWIYRDTAAALAHTILSKFGNSAGNNEYRFYVNTTNQLQIDLYGGTSIIGTKTHSVTLGANTWYFCYAFHDPVANLCGVALNDGVLETAATTAVGGTSGREFQVGDTNSLAAFEFNGRICELGMMRGNLEIQERAFLYNQGIGRTYPWDGHASIFGAGRGHGQMVGARRNRLVGVSV